jgi:outer membrane protein
VWRRLVAVAAVGSLWSAAALAVEPKIEPKPAGLLALYADALDHNAAYRAQAAQLRMVAELEPQAAGRLLPQLGLRGSYDQVHEDINGSYYGVVQVDSSDDFPVGGAGAQLTQALYRPELWIERDQAKLRLQQAQLVLEAAQDQLLVSLVTTYFAVLAAEDNVALTGAEKDAVARQLEQARGRHAAGLATEADFQVASAQHSLTEAGLLEAKTKVEAAYAALDVVAGHPLRTLMRLPETVALAPPQPARVEDWVERARNHNLQVLEARLGSQVAQREVDRAHKLSWPKLDLVGRAFYLDSGGGLTGERVENEQRIGISLSLPLYAGGAIDATVRQAQAGEERSQALLSQAQAEAARDARVAFLSCQAGLSRLPALTSAVQAARAAESAIRSGFDAGTHTSAEVLRAVEARYEAERDLAAARYKFMLDSLRLKQVAGNLVVGDLSVIDRSLRPRTAAAR